MSCETIEERLPWLLNGSLAPDERALIEAHLAGCAACRAALAETRLVAALLDEHPTAAALTAHVFEPPADAEAREAIEGHLVTCAACREEATLLAASREAMSAATTARTGRAPRLLLAASLAAVVLAGIGWIATWQELRAERRSRVATADRTPVPPAPASVPTAPPAPPPAAEASDATPPDPALAARVATLERSVAELGRPRVGVGVAELLPLDAVQRGGAAPGATLTVGQPAALLLVADGLAAGEHCRVRVVRPDDTTAWESRATATVAGELTLHLPAGFLRPGTWRIELTPDGEPLARYTIAVD